MSHEPNTPSRDIAIPAEFAAQVVPKGARRLGLVVGIDCYEDSRIPNLKAAVADAKAMHALMVDPACGLFDPANTRVLLDAEATVRNLGRELERLEREAGTDDEVWIYFAGHGVVQNGEHRLVPYDGEREYLGSSSVKFAECAARIRCRRKIVFLDCCHSGATEGSTRYLHSVEDVLKSYDAQGTVTYCSSDGDQKSVELPELGRGAFSYWLERGLRGEADSDGNGVVTSDELWDFLRQRVEREAMRTTGMRQAPRVKLDASGRFALSVHPKAIELRSRERADTERTLGILRRLLGEDDETHLSTDEFKRARTLLESSGGITEKPARLIRKAAEDFERDNHAEAAVMLIRATLQRSKPDSAVPTNFSAVVTPAPTSPKISPSQIAPPAQASEAQPPPPLSVPMESATGEASIQPTSPPVWIGIDSATPLETVKALAYGKSADARNEYARRLAKGLGVPRNDAEAVRWYKLAVDLGSPAAMFRLGYCYYHGSGVSRDNAKALYWWQRAAQDGFPEAQHDLGVRYLRGLGVPRDEAAGTRLIDAARANGWKSARQAASNLPAAGGCAKEAAGIAALMLLGCLTVFLVRGCGIG